MWDCKNCESCASVVFSGHARIVHLLLERNKSGMIPSDSQGATPLHYGAQSNYAVRYTSCMCVCVCVQDTSVG